MVGGYGGPFVSKLISRIRNNYVKKNTDPIKYRFGFWKNLHFFFLIIDAVRLEGEKISSVCGDKICREKR